MKPLPQKLRDSHTRLLRALKRLLACSQPTGMDTKTDRAMRQAQKAIAKVP